ncbi:MAG: hypothetical protein KUG81_04565 [Gammaproteobacteria bacterium]|nr:hypothetical protein [Gammaproteobacteria bacterium]
MFLDKKIVTSAFKNEILPSLAKFVANNIHSTHNSAFRGEFYTLIRRHLNFLTNPSSFNIMLNNIEEIGVTNEGVITAIGFNNQGYSSNRASKREAVEILNNVLKDIDYNFNDYKLKSTLNSIVDKINLATIIKPLQNE